MVCLCSTFLPLLHLSLLHSFKILTIQQGPSQGVNFVGIPRQLLTGLTRGSVQGLTKC